MSKIDYDLRLIRAVAFDVDGVLSPSTVPMAPDGTPCRMVNIKDGYAIHLAAKTPLKMAIISGGTGEPLRMRYLALGLKDIYLGCSDKLSVLNEWMDANNLSANEVAFVGDDIPDIPPMRKVGLAVTPRDAAPEVKAIARYITRAEGGMGVARELLEEIMKVNGTWMADSKAFGW